jgi:LysR family transcriptional regulator (chromosome initiation inhibitor)
VVVLEPRRWLDVPLYWQHAAVRSSTLQHITQALRTAASGILR